ncbi:unnamed protein product [Merluccius merluccius]
MKKTAGMKPRELHRLASDYNSVFLNQQSYSAALLAAGAACNAARSILTGEVCNAVAIVRPPGHHAEKESACGFCLFNTAAVTARYAQSITHNAPLRVLILDWDVHHGNGTQHMFQEDDSVLYISLHRYDNGTFFPSSEDADCDRVGVGQGAGFNVNIPWSGGRMGDSDYLAAFHHIVLPIATEFNPGLVVVSAGFDAARGDPLGGYHVTPEGYAHLTHLLCSLAGGKVLIILEEDSGLDQLTQGLATLDINQATATNEMPVTPGVDRARQKVVPQKSLSEEEVKMQPHRVTAEDSQSAASRVEDSQLEAAVGVPGAMSEEEGACGWSKSSVNLELCCVNVRLPCQDCGSEAENWTCLTCYQVFCGRYVNEHMVVHGAVAQHPIVLSFSDLSVWCYHCEAYLHNKVGGSPGQDCHNPGPLPQERPTVLEEPKTEELVRPLIRMGNYFVEAMELRKVNGI